MSLTPTPPRLTRAERTKLNRDALLDAAVAVFSARGFRVATLDEVAAEAGLTKGAVYSQFANKQDLFAAAIERRYAQRRQAFATLMGSGDPEATRIRAAAEEFAASVTADGDWALLFLEAWAESLRDDVFGRRIREIADEFREAMAAHLRQLLAGQGIDGEVDPHRLAEMILVISHGFGIEHRVSAPHAPPDLLSELMSTFVAGVQALLGPQKAAATVVDDR